MWDSERVDASISTLVPYEGTALQSDTDYFWRVQVWDEKNEASEWSEVAVFSTALLYDEDWKAKWIGRGPAQEPFSDTDHFMSEENQDRLKEVTPDLRSPLFRKEFDATKPVRRARVFVSGFGFYELHLNGGKVGDALLSPSKTDYRKLVLYDTYDITELLREGANTFGVTLGNGWFNPQREWWSWRMQWYGSPRMILQAHIEYADGTRDIITSDESWNVTSGPVTFSCVYTGEDYDARQEKPGWDTSGYDDTDWEQVNLVESPGGILTAATHEPVQAHETIRPVDLCEPQEGVYVFDMGKNFSGWVRLRVSGEKGQQVVLKFTEKQSEDGMIDVSNLSLARPRDRYTLKGTGEETYEPTFTWHGFRYVELTGFPGVPTLDTIEGVFVHTACSQTGNFSCDNEFVNRLHTTTVHSQRCNLHGLPLDCPQRDERLGWLGDAHVTAEEAMHNLDMARLYTKWLRDIKAQQDERGAISMIAPRPGIEEDLPWSSAYFLIPWYMYLHYGDKRVIEDHFATQNRYMEYLATQAENHIQKTCWWGDHLSVDENWKHGSGMPHSISTAFYYANAWIMAREAAVLGREDDRNRYAELATSIRNAFIDRYFDADTGVVDGGSQTALALALVFGLVPEGKESDVLESLLKNISDHGDHLTTGLIGTKYLFDALQKCGRPDVNWMLLNQTGFPSWRDLLGDDMTSLPEHWNGDGSLNHIVQGSIDTWLYRSVAGIDSDELEPGYEMIHITPFIPENTRHAEAEIGTLRGPVKSRWTVQENEFRLTVDIPANSKAKIRFPVPCSNLTESGNIVWDGAFHPRDGVNACTDDSGTLVLTVDSGSYAFSCKRS